MSTAHSEYMTKVKLGLDRLHARMDLLQATASQTKAARAWQEYCRELRKLHHQSGLALANLDEVTAAGEEGWDKRVVEVARLLNAFRPFVRPFQVAVSGNDGATGASMPVHLLQRSTSTSTSQQAQHK